MNRRSFFAILFGIVAARFAPRALPKPTGGLFNPHQNIAAEYEKNIGAVLRVKKPVRFCVSSNLDYAIAFQRELNRFHSNQVELLATFPSLDLKPNGRMMEFKETP